MYNEVKDKPQPTARQNSLPTSPLAPAGAAVATEIISPPKDFKSEVTALRDKLNDQRAQGATAAEIETTIKAAGKLVADEVKTIEIFDLSPAKKINIYDLRDTINAFIKRLNFIHSKVAQQEYKELYDVYLKIQNEIIFFEKEYPNQQRKIFMERAKQIKDILSKVRLMGATPEQLSRQFGSSTAIIRTMIEKALNCYPADWVESSVNFGSISLKKAPTNERGFYSSGQRLLQIENMYQFDKAIHELGHRMEDVIKEILDAETEFYSRRTAGEKLEKLSILTGDNRYDDWEIARKDKFLNVYMGKDYGGNAYELVSMGFEYAYTNPELLLQDEDMAEWIYGLLALI